ncbi:MAG: hypothetical protein P9M07_03070, partial [Candidatus Aceula meridiana]|nr:hypothetical protein [Candidatus Aceula meridiana]
MKTREEWADRLMVPLYEKGYIETIWNTKSLKHQREGWRLKDGSWSPWFFNMRPIGSTSILFFDICCAMADLVKEHDLDMYIGIDMAGILPLGGVAVASAIRNAKPLSTGYTRPLSKKVRTPMEAFHLLQKMDGDVAGYGQKDYVEAIMFDGMNIGIFDDMSTGLGSKIIARLIVLWEAKRRGLNVICNQIFYFLNRGAKNIQTGLDFAKEKEQGLSPEALDVHYVLEFDE